MADLFTYKQGSCIYLLAGYPEDWPYGTERILRAWMALFCFSRFFGLLTYYKPVRRTVLDTNPFSRSREVYKHFTGTIRHAQYAVA